jgi:hypothetical protein
MAAHTINPRVAPMLASVTLFVVIVRFGSSFIDLAGEGKFNPNLLGRGLCCKSPGEAKGSAFRSDSPHG